MESSWGISGKIRWLSLLMWSLGFPLWFSGKEFTCNVGVTGDTGSIPGLGRSPGGGQGNPLQHSCLENTMDRGTWQATIHRVSRSQTWLKWLSTHACDPHHKLEEFILGWFPSEASFESQTNKSSPTRIKALQLLGMTGQHSESLIPPWWSSVDKAYIANMGEVENSPSNTVIVLRKKNI